MKLFENHKNKIKWPYCLQCSFNGDDFLLTITLDYHLVLHDRRYLQFKRYIQHGLSCRSKHKLQYFVDRQIRIEPCFFNKTKPGQNRSFVETELKLTHILEIYQSKEISQTKDKMKDIKWNYTDLAIRESRRRSGPDVKSTVSESTLEWGTLFESQLSDIYQVWVSTILSVEERCRGGRAELIFPRLWQVAPRYIHFSERLDQENASDDRQQSTDVADEVLSAETRPLAEEYGRREDDTAGEYRVEKRRHDGSVEHVECAIQINHLRAIFNETFKALIVRWTSKLAWIRRFFETLQLRTSVTNISWCYLIIK